ncbi:hypothetical protein VTN00DRAFT_500 [Thermoascus crustaceus]|uniref:uncharacterized protein n=1 Tax=Thermoascus crustaceus TaxID=5088 RepID=UPI00374270FF
MMKTRENSSGRSWRESTGMSQSNARYGFIVTDKELVTIKRLGGDGNIELSLSISWDVEGTADDSKLTAMLALWYLGMLASDNKQWMFEGYCWCQNHWGTSCIDPPQVLIWAGPGT